MSTLSPVILPSLSIIPVSGVPRVTNFPVISPPRQFVIFVVAFILICPSPMILPWLLSAWTSFHPGLEMVTVEVALIPLEQRKMDWENITS